MPRTVAVRLAQPQLKAVRPENPFLAMGLAVNHLMTKPAFAMQRFGDWSRILAGQINRKHYCFVVDEKQQIQGFLGWALTDKAKAEAWAEGRGGLPSYEDSLDGDCVVFNAWSGGGLKVNRLLLLEARKVIAGKAMVYFKRQYKDGSSRPARLTVNEFVAQHIEQGHLVLARACIAADRSSRRPKSTCRRVSSTSWSRAWVGSYKPELQGHRRRSRSAARMATFLTPNDNTFSVITSFDPMEIYGLGGNDQDHRRQRGRSASTAATATTRCATPAGSGTIISIGGLGGDSLRRHRQRLAGGRRRQRRHVWVATITTRSQGGAGDDVLEGDARPRRRRRSRETDRQRQPRRRHRLGQALRLRRQRHPRRGRELRQRRRPAGRRGRTTTSIGSAGSTSLSWMRRASTTSRRAAGLPLSPAFGQIEELTLTGAAAINGTGNGRRQRHHRQQFPRERARRRRLGATP